MARTSYANILQLPDAAQSWNFDLFFPTIPGSNLPSSNLTYKCKTSNIPGSSIEAVGIELHGAKKQEAGRATYSHTFACTFLETIDYATYIAFRQWRNYMRSWKNNTGTNSQAYKVNLELDLFDNAGLPAQTLIIAGSFPTEVTDVALSGADSASVLDLSVTFSFDYVSDGTGW